MDAVAAEVLRAYPSPLRGRMEALGNRGGFSGARLWRVQSSAGRWCLRAGVPAETCEQVVVRHRLMAQARAAGLPFVPSVLDAAGGMSAVVVGGRVWELMEWMPGCADFSTTPTTGRLCAAAQALARVHLAWERLGSGVVETCPAVARRLDAVRRAGGVSPLLSPREQGAHAPRSPQIAALLARWLPRVPGMLERMSRPCRLQPCLRDVWHDHLLFQGDELTGLVDYAAVAQDTVATDVARMLGSLVEDDDEGWAVALSAYREVRPLSHDEEQLARVLDRTGVIVALMNWQRWLTERAREFEDLTTVVRRVDGLLGRVERWA